MPRRIRNSISRGLRRRSQRFLFALPLLPLLAFGLSCSKEKDLFVFPNPDGKNYDYVTQGLLIDSVASGNVEWTMEAERAEIYEKKRFCWGYGIRIRFFKDGKVESTLTGRYGKFYMERDDITITGDVLVQTQNGAKLRAHKLHCDRANGRYSTDGWVEYTSAGGDITRGWNMQADSRLEKVIIEKPEGTYLEPAEETP